MATDMRSPNVSVTSIKVETCPSAISENGDLHSVGNDVITLQNGNHSIVLQNGEPLDSSDAEVAQIDFQSSVNLRINKKRNSSNDMPRPMSWEGELSDGEKNMCTDEDSSMQVPENLSLPQANSVQVNSLESAESPLMKMKQPHIGNYSLHSTPNNSPLLSQRHPVTGAPILSHKDLMHKDIMHKALNVPLTPSPDSAIHSAYSVFSSPNQSPLTQRHVTLTPNLSRNNSDASHSSCCSYSSVSVSVSPTQQFSPTHSPIQGRHMSNVHNSPLHHNILYRNLQEDTTVQYLHDNDNIEEAEDKTGLLHTSLPAQPGISRQQLINRYILYKMHVCQCMYAKAC